MSNYKLEYHLMPPVGWLNDPNGLCQYNGTYHIYYQYCKDVYGNSKKCWGHYSTKDFKNYKLENIALYPDLKIDSDGVYSGCTLIENGLNIFYTGNVKMAGDYDYIHEGRLSNTIYVHSDDGLNFSQKEVVLDNLDYPNDLSCHIRDPKVFKQNDKYYMVLGARDNKDKGLVLLYSSNDLKKWKYENRITSKEKFGYMWECPDLFEIAGDKFLITCPQGIKQEGHLYQNDNQNGYFKIDGTNAYDYQTLDYGYDFYAPHSFLDENNRRILIGWLGLPDSPYINPTVKDGWQNALSLPRQIENINHSIYQYPIKEILDLLENTRSISVDEKTKIVGKKVCQIHCVFDSNFELNLNNLCLKYEKKLFSLIFENDKTNRKQRDVEIDYIEDVDIFLDNSVIEIYLNKGEKVLSSMYYDEEDVLKVSSAYPIKIEYSDVKKFEVK